MDTPSCAINALARWVVLLVLDSSEQTATLPDHPSLPNPPSLVAPSRFWVASSPVLMTHQCLDGGITPRARMRWCKLACSHPIWTEWQIMARGPPRCPQCRAYITAAIDGGDHVAAQNTFVEVGGSALCVALSIDALVACCSCQE